MKGCFPVTEHKTDICSWIEINIGLLCACVPSVAILIEMVRKRGQRSARTSIFAKNTFHRRRAGKVFNQGSTGKLSTFDTELAMWSGDMSTRSGRVGIDGRCKRISSSDGRREGWLKEEVV